MRHHGNGWITRILAASLLGMALLCTPRIGAANQTQVAMAPSSKDDLLMFWDEKELYVQTATRIAKPLTQTAENMTVVTAKDIEAMNAHTVAQVLSRVPGLFMDFTGGDFISATNANSIQGSQSRHITVLLDGMVWNTINNGNADTITIPVQIIDRIEIVKGPGSSAWGSSLGGVINIITKDASNTTKGSISASYGEANSQDYSAELSGKGGAVGYYLFAGRQQSDGLRFDRDANANKVYSKVSLSPTPDLDLNLSIGFGDYHSNTTGSNPLITAFNSTSNVSTFFVTGNLDYRITPDLDLKVSVHSLRVKFDIPATAKATNSLIQDLISDEQAVGGEIKMAYSSGTHAAVLGADLSHGTLDAMTVYPPPTGIWRPVSQPVIDKWGVFANDTIDFGRLAVTPGIRYDQDNISGGFVSPSIGATYELAEHTVARTTISRGFTSPSLAMTSAGGLRITPNPDLKAEYGWSYQVGLETGLTDYLNVKSTLFRHEMTNEFYLTRPAGATKFVYKNGGNVLRQGYELEAETAPAFNISLKAGHTYTHINDDANLLGQDMYSYLIGIKYDDRKSLLAQLTGAYIWWNLPASPPPYPNCQYNTFIWDLNAVKRFQTTDRITTELFATVHNIFGGAYYTTTPQFNPNRWVEGGLRFKF